MFNKYPTHNGIAWAAIGKWLYRLSIFHFNLDIATHRFTIISFGLEPKSWYHFTEKAKQNKTPKLHDNHVE